MIRNTHLFATDGSQRSKKKKQTKDRETNLFESEDVKKTRRNWPPKSPAYLFGPESNKKSNWKKRGQ